MALVGHYPLTSMQTPPECLICWSAEERPYFYHKGGKGLHLFHRSCLATWLLYQSRCPLCREEINEDALISWKPFVKSTVCALGFGTTAALFAAYLASSRKFPFATPLIPWCLGKALKRIAQVFQRRVKELGELIRDLEANEVSGKAQQRKGEWIEKFQGARAFYQACSKCCQLSSQGMWICSLYLAQQTLR